MTRKTLSTFARIVTLILVSFLIGAAMTRFTYTWASGIPDWMADTVRSSYEALGYQAVGIEDITNGSFLGRLLVCWFLAAFGLWASRRSSRRIIPSFSWFLVYTVGSFVGAYLLANCIYLTVTAPIRDRWMPPFESEPYDFQVLYVLGALITCWLGVLAAALALRTAVKRRRARSRRGTDGA